MWSPFAPLGRGDMGWGDPGFRSAPPLGLLRAPRCGWGGLTGQNLSHEGDWVEAKARRAARVPLRSQNWRIV